MSDLISRDELRKDIKESMRNNNHEDFRLRGNHNIEHLNFLTILSQQPVAFDKDKMVERLKVISERFDNESPSDIWTRFGISIAIGVIEGWME